MKNQISLFLDSGAYSAMMKGVKIDIDDYIDFIKKYKRYIDIYACLDVIGSAEETYENQKYMESKGLSPLITFHKGENYNWLKKYINEYDYIALGGLVGKGDSMVVLREHLDKCFEMICDNDKGMPKLKIHGFGITSLPVLIRYPWYSVDSTSWVLTGRFGAVFVPKRTNGKYDYLRIPYKIIVSDKAPSQKEAGRHFNTFSQAEQKIISEYFKIKDYNIKELSSDYKKRDELNIIYFLDLEENLPVWPWSFKLKKTKGLGLI